MIILETLSLNNCEVIGNERLRPSNNILCLNTNGLSEYFNDNIRRARYRSRIGLVVDHVVAN